MLFAKLYLQRHLTKLDNDHPDASPKSFVDDCSFSNASKFRRQVITILHRALKDFKDGIKVLQFVRSDKAVITASSNRFESELSKVLSNEGLVFKMSKLPEI